MVLFNPVDESIMGVLWSAVMRDCNLDGLFAYVFNHSEFLMMLGNEYLL